ncbi:putative inorganic polyphosphate/ATP-NAD kinase [Anaerohalosphaera lusitana]|uniref:NAD kinase n=1 Tax=Anaerohalosphaera lusitana TaxID=1936003 RepID=A0A1U9NHL8_9BACT|nr:NAD(+)/NADH kinase [Anaerohalosphaera lusitana]AQT67006.1 putative inorganic polyphosphate/ATP-NAD kinase [Anaerohalosphaera lusitana]
MPKAKIIIFGDPERKYATEASERFIRFVDDRVDILANCFMGDCAVDFLRKADFAVVFGGDGTILSAARDLCEADVPVIGVNVGKLGFLAEFSVDELEELFEDILAGQTKIEKRMILHCSISRGKEPIFESTAVNDVAISAGAPFHMIDLKMTVQGQSLASCVGDGLIISTPTGSTAYNLSAGGPILSANLSAFVVTPVCPHSLSFRPIVISDKSIIEVESGRVNDNTTITLDGQISHKLKKNDVVKVFRHHGSFLVVNNPMRTQWDTLAEKLSWAEKPKYRYKHELARVSPKDDVEKDEVKK